MGVLRCSVAASLFPEPEGVDSCSTLLRKELHLLRPLGAHCSSLDMSCSPATTLSLTGFAPWLHSRALAPGAAFHVSRKAFQPANDSTSCHVRTHQDTSTAADRS